MRLVAFTDYVYHERSGQIYAERAFALFLVALGDHLDQLTIVGRLAPGPGQSHYVLPEEVRFVALPYYRNLTHPVAVMRSMGESMRRFWRALDDADAAWLLGPFPHAIVFALLTRLRRRRLVLGVRQDFPAYVRSRHPGRWPLQAGADLLEWTWRALGWRAPVVVVGRELARKYGRARRVLEVTVSLVSQHDVELGQAASARSYDGELRVLSVGRIDREKNPLLLAEVLALLRERDGRFKLVVCGEGPLSGELRAKLEQLGVSEHAEMLGYVPLDGGLLELYRSSHVFLHVSLTEGYPQVLVEAFASGLPVVATCVGGVPDAAEGASLLIPPTDAKLATEAVLSIVRDPDLRDQLVAEGLARARSKTIDAEVARIVEFIRP